MGFSNKPDVQLTGVNFGPRGKSLYFQADAWDEPEYVPISQCEFVPEEMAEEQGRGVITIRGWLADKNGWREI